MLQLPKTQPVAAHVVEGLPRRCALFPCLDDWAGGAHWLQKRQHHLGEVDGAQANTTHAAGPEWHVVWRAVVIHTLQQQQQQQQQDSVGASSDDASFAPMLHAYVHLVKHHCTKMLQPADCLGDQHHAVISVQTGLAHVLQHNPNTIYIVHMWRCNTTRKKHKLLTFACQLIMCQPVPCCCWKARSTSAPAIPSAQTGGGLLLPAATPSTPLSVPRQRNISACLPPVAMCQAHASMPIALCTATAQDEPLA